jgi:TfoX/Sxy family transcriptional regulator of competence genes
MDKASAELVARFEGLVEVVADADRKLVFGSPTCLFGGNMFFGVHASGLFVKLPTDVAQELLAAGGVGLEPMPGRAMGGFYVLPEALPDQEQWVRRAYEYALALPPKTSKARKARKARKGPGVSGASRG